MIRAEKAIGLETVTIQRPRLVEVESKRISKVLRNHNAILSDVRGDECEVMHTMRLFSDGHELRGKWLYAPAEWQVGPANIDASRQIRHFAETITGVLIPAEEYGIGQMPFYLLTRETVQAEDGDEPGFVDHPRGVHYFMDTRTEGEPLVDLRLV